MGKTILLASFVALVLVPSFAQAAMNEPTVRDPNLIAMQEDPTREVREKLAKMEAEEARKAEKLETFLDQHRLCVYSHYKSFRTGFFGADRDWQYYFTARLVNGKRCSAREVTGDIVLSNIRAGSSVLEKSKTCRSAKICKAAHSVDNESGKACLDVTISVQHPEFGKLTWWAKNHCGSRRRTIGGGGTMGRYRLQIAN